MADFHLTYQNVNKFFPFQKLSFSLKKLYFYYDRSNRTIETKHRVIDTCSLNLIFKVLSSCNFFHILEREINYYLEFNSRFFLLSLFKKSFNFIIAVRISFHFLEYYFFCFLCFLIFVMYYLLFRYFSILYSCLLPLETSVERKSKKLEFDV